jgi:murein DD-endopeptidase MepM/ murein hydrolase activator NlpD
MRGRGLLWCRFAALAVVTLGIGLGGAPTAHASVASDQARIVEIQHKIADEGARVRSLVVRENTAQDKVDALTQRITVDQRRILADRRREAAARDTLRTVAARAYITDVGSNSPFVDLLGTNDDMSSLLARRKYAGSVGDHIVNALESLQTAREAVEHDAGDQRAAKDNATHALADLRKQQRAVTAAIKVEQKTLASVKEDLRNDLAAEREAAQLATERALAKYSKTSGPLPALLPATPGSYANPLRSVGGLTPERIDMGVDYAGYGPIYAIGDGIVLTTTVPGWPGGTMIVYQLTDGPANGLVVYAAEDIAPIVNVGDTVTANTVLGLVYLGPDGIETGWGDPARIGNALAGDADQFDGANTTAFGSNFNDMLMWLGAPSGIPQNEPPTGTLPANWPQWSNRPPP